MKRTFEAAPVACSLQPVTSGNAESFSLDSVGNPTLFDASPFFVLVPPDAIRLEVRAIAATPVSIPPLGPGHYSVMLGTFAKNTQVTGTAIATVYR